LGEDPLIWRRERLNQQELVGVSSERGLTHELVKEDDGPSVVVDLRLHVAKADLRMVLAQKRGQCVLF
jgi:hypothetical protein